MLLCTSSKSLSSFLSHSCWVRWPNANTHLGQTLLDGPTVLCLGWCQRISLPWEEISSDCGLISTKLLGYNVADIIEQFRTCTFPSFYSFFAFVYSVLIVDVSPRCTKGFFFSFLRTYWKKFDLCKTSSPTSTPSCCQFLNLLYAFLITFTLLGAK